MDVMSKCRSTSFCELRFKDVINICDGRRMGRVIDIVIDVTCGKVRGIVVPGVRSINIFRRCEDIFIPWRNILRIGEDVLLVEIIPPRESNNACNISSERPRPRNRNTDFYAVSASLDLSQSNEDNDDKEDKEEDLKPKVLKYLTATSDESE